MMSMGNVTGRHQLLVCKTLSSSTAMGMTKGSLVPVGKAKGSQVPIGKVKGSPYANGRDDGHVNTHRW